jgi:putative ABC transport system permease protein
MFDDLHGALRQLRANPGTSLTSVLALGLGIGFCASTYSTADTLLFRPLPIPGLDRVVSISGQERGQVRGNRALSAVDYREWKHSARTVEALGLSRAWEATLSGKDDPVMVEGSHVDAGFFAVMRLRPLLGRVFTSEEETPGNERSVILSQNLWERQFGSDPRILGREIELSGWKYRVVGVLPKGFTYPQPSEFWTPLALSSKAWADHCSFYLHAVARLKPGVRLEEARAEFAGLAELLQQRYPDSHANVLTRLALVRETASGDLTAQYTLMTLGSALFLLVIACANVASLQFARVTSRTREMAIRSALGARRWRLLRQVLTESVVVACAGAALGLLFAVWSLDLIRAAMPAEVERFIPSWYRLGLNSWVLLWTTVTAACAGVLSGLGPAIWLSRTPTLAGPLHESSRSTTGGVGRQNLRGVLVIGQTALALVLLVGATLMVKGFRSIGQLPLATQPEQLLTVRLNLPSTRYQDRASVVRFQKDLLDRLQSASGVQSAALASTLPYSSSGMNRSYVNLEGRPAERGKLQVTQVEPVSPAYFRTLGLAVKRGRAFSGSESAGAQRVALVNETFARRYWEGLDPIGRRFDLGDGQWWTVTGVTADVVYDCTQRSANPIAYLPFQQSGWNGFEVLVQTAGDPMALLPAVRQAVRAIDPLQAIALPRTYRKMMDDNLAGVGYVAKILTALACVALFLALLGVYSVMAWSVNERTREIGVRLALGATRTNILWMVSRKGVIIVGVSLLAGVPASIAMARLLRGLLFGVSSSDMLVLAGVPLALTLAGVLACALPARRATRTDPLIALRHE